MICANAPAEPMEFFQNLVYRLYSVEGELLYVGCTTDIETRLYEHGRTQSWWSQVGRVECDDPRPRGEAFASEREQIRRLAPRFNIVCNPRHEVAS